MTPEPTDPRPVILAPGRYWVGDPAFTLDPSVFAAALKDHFNRSELGGMLEGEVEGLPFVAIPTAFGDGVYLDGEGYQYPVDSGFLGATPVRKGQGETNPVRMVEFEEPAVVEVRGGLIRFGAVEIETDPDGELKAA